MQVSGQHAGADHGPVDRWWRSADGLRLHAVDYAGAAGDARLPVICIHGLTRNARDFAVPAARIAAAGRRVLAVDVRGRGRSDHDRDPANYRPSIYARDIAALAGALGIGRALFVGTSMGGLITLELAQQRPDLVAGSVINDIGPELASEGLARIAGYVGTTAPLDSWADAAARVAAQNRHALGHYGPAEWDAMARRLYRTGADDRPVADYDPAIAAAFRGGAVTADLWPRWRALAAGRPTLLIRGAISDLLSAAAAARMRSEAPDADYTEVAGVGHAPMLDEPDLVPALDAFFAKAP